MVKIKELPENERPREKLELYGASSLSNEELLAILLKTGNKNYSAKELACQILKKIKEISELKELTFEEFIKIEGIGPTKAVTLLAALELGKRVNVPLSTIHKLKINNSSILFEYYKNRFQDELQEHFVCVYLDNQKKVIREKTLFKGTLNQTIIHPREIFKEAYKVSASSIICIHNHPSGNINPSIEDIQMTDGLKQIGDLLGIPLIDHLIIGKEEYYSFFENGKIR